MPNGRILTLALLAALAPGLAVAQINPFRGRGADRLTGDDLRLVTEASNNLLARPELSTGAGEGWRNPKSGATGSVRVNNTFQRQGLTCHALGYEAQISKGLAPRSTTLTWCRTHEGAWKIAS